MKPLIRMIVGLASCGISLALAVGCGTAPDLTPGSGNGSSPAETTSASGAQRVTIVARDNIFAPTDYTAEAGKPLTVVMTNSGANIHEVEVKGLIPETQLSPGQSKTVNLVNVAAGTYEVYCEVHADQGMKGQLAVK